MDADDTTGRPEVDQYWDIEVAKGDFFSREGFEDQIIDRLRQLGTVAA